MRIQEFESNKAQVQAHKTFKRISSNQLSSFPYHLAVIRKVLVLIIHKLITISCYL